MPSHDDESLYPRHLIERAKNPRNFGRMNDPTACSYVKGPCGDEMEFYLVIKDGFIKDVKFYTEGCVATRVSGSMAAEMAEEKSIDEALGISPRDVMSCLKGLPEDHCHCAILAVSALYKALADYLLKK